MLRNGCRGRQDLGARLTTMSRGASGGRTGRASLPAAPVLLVSDDAVVLEKGGAYRYDIFTVVLLCRKGPWGRRNIVPTTPAPVLDRLCYSVLDWHHAHVETAPGLLLRRADRRRGPPPGGPRWADGQLSWLSRLVSDAVAADAGGDDHAPASRRERDDPEYAAWLRRQEGNR